MNALTINQPFAHLIVSGEKRVENRKWKTRFRGPLAIHAGISRKRLDLDDAGLTDASGVPVSEMEFGAIIGVVDVVDCLPIADIRAGRWDEKYPWIKSHFHTEGPWCWVLANPRPLAVRVKIMGSLGLWSWNVSPERLKELLPAPAGASRG